MTALSGSRRLALRLSVGAISALLLAGNSPAETIRTVNGVDIDSAVRDLYFETRFGKPVSEGTPQETEMAMQELVDLYLLTTQPRSLELAGEPRTKAQVEIQRLGMLAQVIAGDYMQRNPATEEEVLAEYKEQIAKAPRWQFKARHILVETQAAAEEIIASLDGGADFAELAKEKSTGPSGPNGGDLGWFSPDQMVLAFSSAVAKLEDGSYSKEPVQTNFGWHVILREDSRENQPPTLESSREVIMQRLAQMKFAEYLQSLRQVQPD